MFQNKMDVSNHKNENVIEARAYRFETKKPYISVRIATKEEIKSYRNWALNPHDLQHFTGAYPHASANVETRNDATFLLAMRLTVPLLIFIMGRILINHGD